MKSAGKGTGAPGQQIIRLFLGKEAWFFFLKAVETAGKGMRVSFKVPEKVRPNDKLFKIVKSPPEG